MTIPLAYKMGTEMYKVIGHKNNRTLRVLWALEEMSQSYELVEAQPRSDTAKLYSNNAKVPSLQVGDTIINDSLAIIEFLADKHQMLTFTAGTIERAKQDSFTFLILDEIEGALWTAAKHSFVLPEKLRVPEVKAACKYDFDNALNTLADRLGTQKYLMGDKFTIPDLVMGHCALWANKAGFKIENPKIQRYLEAILNRKALINIISSSI
ncbi:glutathione S-transferase family protein [Polycladidibacter stylochi]|uniref:glutathione S-transferase family protein n=1 Tax=Polycladidibacter stylochi TaxID=1807766 RepID=UPI000833BE53|nr:glutathione S-transferase family protein [Pseudovibrio stylochi]